MNKIMWILLLISPILRAQQKMLSDDSRKYECNLCMAKYGTSRELDSHKKICPGDVNLVYAALQSNGQITKIDKKKAWQCPICRLSFPAKEIDGHRMETGHTVVSGIISIQNSDGFQCGCCNEVLNTEKMLIHGKACCKKNAKNLNSTQVLPIQKN